MGRQIVLFACAFRLRHWMTAFARCRVHAIQIAFLLRRSRISASPSGEYSAACVALA
jgi:hypothetical protein